jgi:hypothetical protein
LICLAFCWKLVLSADYTWIDNPDVTQMDVPRLQFQHDTFSDGRFPLWDPHLWCGQPFLGQIVGAAFPLNWPLFFVPLDANGKIPMGALNWYFVLLHVLAALAAYALCRDLQCSRAASVLGGFVYSFDGIIASTLWPEVFGSLLLAPLVMLYLFRALRREQPYPSAALCGMFLGASWLAGHHEIPIYLSFTVAGIWLFDLVRTHEDRRRAFALAAVTFLVAALTSGFQTIPGIEYAREAVRWVGLDHPVGWKDEIPYRIHDSHSLYPSSLLTMILPRVGGNPEAFLGVAVLALAVIAVCAAWRSRYVRLVTCIALLGVFFAMGGYNLLHGLAYSILPVFDKARIPSRMLALFDLGVAVLAATGLDALASGIATPTFRAIRWTLIGFGTIVLATGLVLVQADKPITNQAFYLAALCALAVAAVLSAHRSSRITTRALSIVLFLIVFVELGNHLPAVLRERTAAEAAGVAGKLTGYRDIAEFLRRQTAPTRIHLEGENFNFGDWEGIDMLGGFGAGATANLVAIEWPSARIQNLLAVHYTVTQAPPRPDQELVFRGRGGASVYKNRDAFPRARIVHRVEQAASVEKVRQRIADPAFDLATAAVVVAPAPPVESCTGAEFATIKKRTANSVIVDSEFGCRGMLVLADTWYPGWVATVDGRPATIYEAYGALRGVVASAGTHRIEFRYRPATAWIGAACSLFGILGAGIVCVLFRRATS